jgi:hypothetical protein
MQPLPKGVRFAISLAILGVVMFILPPEVAGILGLILVLGALASTGVKNPAAPIAFLGKIIYGG